MMQLFSLQRQSESPDRTGENSSSGQDLLELILSFEPNNDDSSGDEGDAASLDDLFS